jgi:hypothetical protein
MSAWWLLAIAAYLGIGWIPVRNARHMPWWQRALVMALWPVVGVIFFFVLSGCAGAPVPVALDPPEPPNVTQCRQGRTDDAPKAPKDWYRDGARWGIAVLAILQDERNLRGKEHGCVDGLAGKGIVR